MEPNYKPTFPDYRRLDNSYSLGETGRKILAPTYEGEREEGIRKALFTPSVLSRFFTDYNGSFLPSEELFPNVLETRYQIPRERTKEAMGIIWANAQFAGALREVGDGKVQLFFGDAPFPLASPQAISREPASENEVGSERTEAAGPPTVPIATIR